LIVPLFAISPTARSIRDCRFWSQV
jgi:hypothetical protein